MANALKTTAPPATADRVPAAVQPERPAAPRRAAEPAASQQAFGNQALVRGFQAEAAQRTPAARLIVDDAVADVGQGQMRRSEFLRHLRGEVTSTAEAGLEAAGRSTRDCPYLRLWFAHYRGRSAAALQRDVRRYAPETAWATEARDYVEAIGVRVRQAVDAWVETGAVTGVPLSLRGAVAMRTLPGRLGSGQPLDEGTRQRMESVFRSDFSRVRIHTEKEGAALSDRLHAQAVTVGEDIAFAPGSYAPGTPMGDAILAHELAHVVQQRPGDDTPGQLAVEPQGSPHEREAEDAAVGVVASLWAADREGARPLAEQARPALHSPRRFQRCGYTVERPPHTFKSCGFSASGEGPLTIRGDATRVLLRASKFSASSDVTIQGGTDAQARGWQTGFVQTVMWSRRQFDYEDSAGKLQHCVARLRGPTRDGVPGTPPPWLGPGRVWPFTKTNSTIKAKMEDTPEALVPRQNAHGRLVRSEGEDRYCTWLVVRQRADPPNRLPVFLNWATWEVDWKARFKSTGTLEPLPGSGTKNIRSGEGQGGPEAPNLGPIVAAQNVEVTPPNCGVEMREIEL